MGSRTSKVLCAARTERCSRPSRRHFGGPRVPSFPRASPPRARLEKAQTNDSRYGCMDRTNRARVDAAVASSNASDDDERRAKMYSYHRASLSPPSSRRRRAPDPPIARSQGRGVSRDRSSAIEPARNRVVRVSTPTCALRRRPPVDPPKIGLGAFGFNFGALHLAEAALASAPSARTIVARADPRALAR